jgi:hypothetical protein
MQEDEIIEEVRRARQEYAEKFNFDVHAIGRDLRAKQAAENLPVVSLEPRKPRTRRSKAAIA